jgi:hypothetical protein
MTGGLIQLVAYGYEDLYLTGDPQITYFKIVYRRHTNFSLEQIPQYFINEPNFGKKSTCILSKCADLIGGATLVVTIPKIKKIFDEKVKFAWVKRIGFAMIKKIEIEINGRVIDRHYGEWLNLWTELTGQINGNQSYGVKKTIGDVPQNTDFTSQKEEYTLYIPLQFWFCRNSGMSIPLVALQYSDVKINVEFQDVEKCYMLTPTHYIKCRDDIVNFEKYEYIEQNIDGSIRAGIFIDYDIYTKQLYYYKLTDEKITSIPVSNSFDINDSTQINIILTSPTAIKYNILGKTSNATTIPEFNNYTVTYPIPKLKNMNIVKCFILVDYYYLDDDERLKFSQASHDYLIEQLYYTPEILIDNSNYNSQIVVENPCKLMVWVTQLLNTKKSNDYYNYTDSYQNKVFKTEYPDVKMDFPVGKSLITNQTVLINGNPRISYRTADYFDTTQMHMHTHTTPLKGMNIYSFGLDPYNIQPSGAINTSQVDNIEVKLLLNSSININNKALFRGYLLCNNILRISNGLAAMVFIK